MSTLSIIGTILFWGVVGLIYYHSEIRPHQAEGFFQDMRRSYAQVLNGERTYYSFINDYYQECQIARPKDSPNLIILKSKLSLILQHEDFVKGNLAKPKMTHYRFLEAWSHYEPSVESEQINTKRVPEVFTKGKGKEIMDKMVSKGYCEPETLKWNPEKSSYLMAMFSTAIAKELNLKKNPRKPFNDIWGNNGKNNLSSLEAQALDSKVSDELIREVKELFPNYSSNGD